MKNISLCAIVATVCARLLVSTSLAQTTTYPTAGIFTNTVPALVTTMTVKLWGAGGGQGGTGLGGGGAFSQVTMPVTAGATYVVVVGQRGTNSGASLGGIGSGNTQGGAPGFLGDYNQRGQGGQGSSIFQLTNGLYVTKAVAGAGGGGGIDRNGGAGGKAGTSFNNAIGGAAGTNGVGGGIGTSASAGSNYSSSATTTGISSLNLANGNGGNAKTNWSGGGGGGFGGGGGGDLGSNGSGAGGGGGGSLGDIITLGSGNQPGNTADANYVVGAATATQDGLVVVTFTKLPVATGMAANNVQFTIATLNASVNPSGAATGYWFDYGTTTNYGSTPLVQSLPAGSASVAVSQTISNLMAGTLYHFRASASNNAGTTIGFDVVFITPVITNTFASAGTYTIGVPLGVNKMLVKLWGAGGGASGLGTNGGSGGGGAFSTVVLNVTPGDSYSIVVGQRGAMSTNNLGGAGSGNTQGGAPGYIGDYNNRGQGGQASSLFHFGNAVPLAKAPPQGVYFTKAIAGGGGGAGLDQNGGAAGVAGVDSASALGGQPGGSGTGGAPGGGTIGSGNFGSNYNATALTTGMASLSLASGSGGNATGYSGGGGGGYGGGGGGGYGVNGDGGGGGGGGSYGGSVILGSGTTPGNTADSLYTNNAGRGGIITGAGNDGLAVVIWSPVIIASPATIKSPIKLANGSFQFSFTNLNGASFTALATTNISTALSNWTVIGTATETSFGQFQFMDSTATNFPARFYNVRSP